MLIKSITELYFNNNNGLKLINSHYGQYLALDISNFSPIFFQFAFFYMQFTCSITGINGIPTMGIDSHSQHYNKIPIPIPGFIITFFICFIIFFLS